MSGFNSSRAALTAILVRRTRGARAGDAVQAGRFRHGEHDVGRHAVGAHVWRDGDAREDVAVDRTAWEGSGFRVEV